MTISADSSGTEPLRSKQIEQYDEERRYLEGLLNNRLNFYMVFASLLILGLLGSDAITTHERAVGLAFGAGVSTLLGIALWRTHLLIKHVLEKLRSMDDHPYAFAYAKVELTEKKIFRSNVNKTFALIPFIFAALFIVLATLTFFADERCVSSQSLHFNKIGVIK